MGSDRNPQAGRGSTDHLDRPANGLAGHILSNMINFDPVSLLHHVVEVTPLTIGPALLARRTADLGYLSNLSRALAEDAEQVRALGARLRVTTEQTEWRSPAGQVFAEAMAGLTGRLDSVAHRLSDSAMHVGSMQVRAQERLQELAAAVSGLAATAAARL